MKNSILTFLSLLFITAITAQKISIKGTVKAANTNEILISTAVTIFNAKDSVLRFPYGQQLFNGIVKDTTTLTQLEVVKGNLNSAGKKYLQGLYDEKLDAILSINNYHSGVAAVALYPTLTVPMGYKKSGEPISLTFIGKPFSERSLLKVGYGFEQLTKMRVIPEKYQ